MLPSSKDEFYWEIEYLEGIYISFYTKFAVDDNHVKNIKKKAKKKEKHYQRQNLNTILLMPFY